MTGKVHAKVQKPYLKIPYSLRMANGKDSFKTSMRPCFNNIPCGVSLKEQFEKEFILFLKMLCEQFCSLRLGF